MIPLTRPAMLRKAQTQRGYHWALEIVVFIALFFVSQLLISVPIAAAEGIAFVTGQTDLSSPAFRLPDWLLPVQLYSTALMILTILLFCRFLQKRGPASLGLAKQHAGREYLAGMLAGILLFSAAIGICAISGTVELRVVPFPPRIWLLFLGGYLIQG